MLLIPNKHVVVPANEEVVVRREILLAAIPRLAQELTLVLNSQTVVALPFTPLAAEWVEIYHNGLRMINSKLTNAPGGAVYKKYNVIGNQLVFEEPFVGAVKIISDTEPAHHPLATIISVRNIQQNNSVPGIYCEPIVLSQPANGYARLSTDRQSIAYLPAENFTGTDSFSYTTISQNGQVGPARCVFVVVR